MIDEQVRHSHWKEGLVSVIVPVLELNRKRRLRYPLAKRRNIVNLLDDLEQTEGVDIEVIVVCNSRDDDLVKHVSSDSRINKYCLNSVNVGVSRAWNMGAMMAEGEFLCFVNDDVELGESCVKKLVEILKSAEDIGQVGPAGRRFSVNKKHGPDVGREEIDEADQILGWLFIIKRAVFDLTDGFDISYTPAGYEDVDISFQIKELGYRCLVVPEAAAIHHGHSGVSSRDITISFLNKEVSTRELDLRNSSIFEKKWKKK